jgi:transposase-like protein
MKQTKGVLIRRRRRSIVEQEIFSALRQFDEAGNITIKEFAAAYQISEATYYNWRKKYQAKEQSLPPTGFTQVDLSILHEEKDRGGIFAEYRGIIFYQRVEAAYLKALL